MEGKIAARAVQGDCERVYMFQYWWSVSAELRYFCDFISCGNKTEITAKPHVAIGILLIAWGQ